jgi:hypothetical protein
VDHLRHEDLKEFPVSMGQGSGRQIFQVVPISESEYDCLFTSFVSTSSVAKYGAVGWVNKLFTVLVVHVDDVPDGASFRVG